LGQKRTSAGTVGQIKRSRRFAPLTDGFAVCGFRATAAKYFDPLQAAKIDRY
jgi:hypothetical protein